MSGQPRRAGGAPPAGWTGWVEGLGRVRWWVLGPVAAYAWWATGLETFSAESTLAVVGGGTAAVAVGTWLRRRWAHHEGTPSPEDRSRRKPGLGIWLLLLGCLAVLQMAMYLQEERDDYPTISSLLNDVLDTHGARTVACTAWLVGTFRLARRP